jgi:putative transcriptional regulator
MSSDSSFTNLTNHFLIAMPGLEDEFFSKSVVYLCEHSQQGALGLIINKPSDLSMQGLFDKVDLPLLREDLIKMPVFKGGPVHTERGFVLHERMAVDELPESSTQPLLSEESVKHSPVKESKNANETKEASIYASTMTVPGGLEMTTSKDVLEAMSTGAGPRRVFISLGYASWGEGQLESELAENSWITVDADASVIFDTPFEQRYERAMGLLGLQPWMISSQAGRA